MTMSIYRRKADTVLAIHGLISFWNFQEAADELPVSQGKVSYVLEEGNGTITRADEGVFGPSSANIRQGQWYRIPRADCPALDFHGTAAFTLCAWIKREGDPASTSCEAVAGMWNETERQRQYCLFLNLQIWDSAQQVCGHVSAEGGPSRGQQYCMSSAIGQSPVNFTDWHFVVFSYDGQYARVYLDGKLDERDRFNPYPYPYPLYKGGTDGSDFTVGAVDRSGEMGNFYQGLLGGLAIYDRSLSDGEIASLYRLTVPHTDHKA